MNGKKIIVGVTGGIAAYKAAELVRILTKYGAEIQVAMTASAVNFIAPLTFEALSKNKVLWKMFDPGTPPLAHINWGQESDLVIIAPATANFIGKMANGIGDDFLSSMILATTARILVCPAMNNEMYANPVTQRNIKSLADAGFSVMEPGKGELACDSEGQGRLPEPEDIADRARIILSNPDLSGINILVTAGPTIESIDPVRFISNRSTGKMGYAIATAAALRGASVTLVSGPTTLPLPKEVDFIGVKSAEDMRQRVLDNCGHTDVVIKAAAVSDYRPRKISDQKVKKGTDSMSLDLVKNPDILHELGKAKSKHGFMLVGFAAETENFLSNAEKKLKEKNLDMIVVNDVSRENAGFGSDTNLVKIIKRDGTKEDLPLMPKDKVADQLLDRIKMMRKNMT